jgi:5-methylcytosine-specific restriction endonuclease McrA
MTQLPTQPHFTPGLCANCDCPDLTGKKLFCSDLCRSTAKLVRYVRSCRNDGRYALPDVREAIQMKVAHVAAGGYSERERRVPPETRAEVFRRADGRCEQCGRLLDLDRSTGDPNAVATIQHVAGNSNDLSNLKAFCMGCNMGDAQSRFVPVEEGSSQEAVIADLQQRSFSPTPLRLCDDEKIWDMIWRKLLSDPLGILHAVQTEGREAFVAQREPGEVLDYEDDDPYGDDMDLPGFLGWTDQGTPIQDC